MSDRQEVSESPKPQTKEFFNNNESSFSATTPVASLARMMNNTINKSPVQRKRTIKFSKIVHNRRIPHLNDLSSEEIETIWIRPEEYLEIRERCISTVKKMMRNQLTPQDMDSGEHCTRGLEGKTKGGAACRREHKLDSIAAVLEEQSMQWNEDVEDEEAIMEVYSVFAYPCAENAYQVGLVDAEAVKEYLSSDSPATEGSSPSTAAATSSAYYQPSTSLMVATAVVDKMREILSLRSSRAALLQEVETNFYEEASIERRQTRRASYHAIQTQANNPLVSHLRDYFSAATSSTVSTATQSATSTKVDRREDDMPSLGSISLNSNHTDCSDEHSTSEDSSSESSSETFTSQLHDIFHSRNTRLSMLDSIEQGYYVEPTIVTTSNKGAAEASKSASTLHVSNVSTVSLSLGSRLKDIFSSRKKRAAVLNELGTSSHHVRHQ